MEKLKPDDLRAFARDPRPLRANLHDKGSEEIIGTAFNTAALCIRLWLWLPSRG